MLEILVTYVTYGIVGGGIIALLVLVGLMIHDTRGPDPRDSYFDWLEEITKTTYEN
jgi:hypothetical protein